MSPFVVDFHHVEEAFLRQTQTQDNLGTSCKWGALGCRFQLDTVPTRRNFIDEGDEMEGGGIVDPGAYSLGRETDDSECV